MVPYDPTKASSYLKLPKKLYGSKHILNIQNIDDEKCALWCIIAHLYPKYIGARLNQNGSRNRRTVNVEAYKTHEKDIRTSNIKFPLQITDISKLEHLNNLIINVFSIDEKENIIPIRISDKGEENVRTIDMLYIVNGKQSYYCLITDLAKLCRSQATSHKGNNYLCRRCLHFSSNEIAYNRHMELCNRHNPQITLYPKKNDYRGRDKVQFTHIERQLLLPYYLTADFECILQKVDTCAPNPSKSNTVILNKHVPCGAAYKISCTDPRFYREPVIITRERDGKSITEQFLDSILADAREIREMLRFKAPMLPLTEQEQIAYDSPNAVCYICNKSITTSELKCRDHDHLSGKFRGLLISLVILIIA